MPPTYIAGYDGSPESRCAVELATRLARSAGASVIAVNVYPHASTTYWIGVEAMRYDELQDAMRAKADRVLDELDAENVDRRVVEADSASRGLHDLAVELDAAMIAVGATHHGAFGRLAPGSVGMHLLHGATCPVLVTPADYSDAPLKTIGVAFEGRAESRAALAMATQLAAQLDAELTVIGAFQPIMATAAMGYPGGVDVLEDEERAFASAVREAADGADASHRIVTGPAGQVLTDASADFDLLVTGSRGYGAIRGVVLGSVSRHLVDHASSPILVVPRPAGSH
jgi:nucleotide-binding universal stress UspA family protein